MFEVLCFKGKLYIWPVSKTSFYWLEPDLKPPVTRLVVPGCEVRQGQDSRKVSLTESVTEVF